MGGECSVMKAEYVLTSYLFTAKMSDTTLVGSWKNIFIEKNTFSEKKMFSLSSPCIFALV